jgi:hypothetical protein
LYNQGKIYKQIAQTARVSLRDIKPVLEKAEKEREKELGINTQEGNNGSTRNQHQTQKASTFSQSYRLFSGGKMSGEGGNDKLYGGTDDDILQRRIWLRLL